MSSTGRLIPMMVLFAAAIAASGCRPVAVSPEASIGWYPSYPLGLEAAHAGGKPLLVYFQAEWCGVCRRLERATLADPVVAQAMKRWTPVRLDVDRESALAQRFQVPAVPALVLFDREDRVVRRIWGFVEAERLSAALVASAPDPANPASE